MGFDVSTSMINLFNRFNKTLAQNGEEEILDEKEVDAANAAGIGSIFNLVVNMTKDEFYDAYLDAYFSKTYGNEESEEAAFFEQKIKEVHIRYVQNQYDSKEPIGDDESVGAYENRLKLANAISKLSKEDKAIYDNAVKNPDNYDIVRAAVEYFGNKVDNGNNDLRPVYSKIYELKFAFTDELMDFIETLPPEEHNILSKIAGGVGLDDDTPKEEAMEILRQGNELADKYSNHKSMQWIKTRIQEYYEYFNQK